MTRDLLYLDTSVLSAYFDDRWPARLSLTRRFWKEALPQYEVMVSDVVLEEISRTKDSPLKVEMLELAVQSTNVEVHLTAESQQLADMLVQAKLIPVQKLEDAYHLALAVTNGADFLTSWNFDHMVNASTQKRLPILSAQAGYFRQMILTSPEAFLEGGHE